MHDETIAHETPGPSEPPADAPGERTAKSRKRDRRGKGPQVPPVSPTESPDSSPVESQRVEQSPGASAGPPKSPEVRRSRGQQGFGDGIDRQICAYCVPVLPYTYPVQGRPGIAVAAYRVVAEVDACQLLCNELHAGQCAWADLTPLDPSEAVSRNWTVVKISGPDPIDAADQAGSESESITV